MNIREGGERFRDIDDDEYEGGQDGADDPLQRDDTGNGARSRDDLIGGSTKGGVYRPYADNEDENGDGAVDEREDGELLQTQREMMNGECSTAYGSRSISFRN